MKKESGNALWLILIAIFLLGGLTVLVARTGSQTEDTGSVEKASIEASKIVSQAVLVKNAVDALFARGCSENTISFNYSLNSDGTENTTTELYNANAPTDFSCHVFHANGTGLNRPQGGESLAFYDRGVTGIGTTKIDAILYKRSFIGKSTRIDISTCDAINKSLANNFLISSLPQSNLSGDPSRGTYTGPTVANTSNDSAMAGVKAGCVIDTSCGSGTCRSFYSVVVVR